jgi:WXG100 family type VII secretion target
VSARDGAYNSADGQEFDARPTALRTILSMAAPKIRADYEQLKAVSGRLGRQAGSTRQTLQTVQQQLDTLQGGDWVGQGATAFYQEMGGQVLPTLKRQAPPARSKLRPLSTRLWKP